MSVGVVQVAPRRLAIEYTLSSFEVTEKAADSLRLRRQRHSCSANVTIGRGVDLQDVALSVQRNLPRERTFLVMMDTRGSAIVLGVWIFVAIAIPQSAHSRRMPVAGQESVPQDDQSSGPAGDFRCKRMPQKCALGIGARRFERLIRRPESKLSGHHIRICG